MAIAECSIVLRMLRRADGAVAPGRFQVRRYRGKLAVHPNCEEARSGATGKGNAMIEMRGGCGEVGNGIFSPREGNAMTDAEKQLRDELRDAWDALPCVITDACEPDPS